MLQGFMDIFLLAKQIQSFDTMPAKKSVTTTLVSAPWWKAQNWLNTAILLMTFHTIHFYSLFPFPFKRLPRSITITIMPLGQLANWVSVKKVYKPSYKTLLFFSRFAWIFWVSEPWKEMNGHFSQVSKFVLTSKTEWTSVFEENEIFQ